MTELKTFSGDLPVELKEWDFMPNGIIPYEKFDMELLAMGMQRYMCVQIESDDISEVIEKLHKALSVAVFLPRSKSTIEGVGYMLRSNTELLWSEFYEINRLFYSLCDISPMPFSHGISEDKAQKIKIHLSAFYFTGHSQKNVDTTEVELDDKFLAQVETVNKSIKQHKND